MHWFMDALRNYANFSGRARRKAYWLYLLQFFVVYFCLIMVLSILSAVLGIGAWLVGGVNALFVLGTLIPGISLGVRRIHDTGNSGLWILVPFALLVIGFMDSEPGANKYGPNPKSL